ncbi:MAG TPA: 4-hydroxythreonine-4-phosphate dehydrogenase PdxA [Acidobacteriota bacterium]|nr:4-hydroxythreonine-4-phosphate dehydrogenase PdxA [Acidobacteriota bacterium]
MKPLLGCSMGDPAGVGPQILLRSATELETADCLLIGDAAVFAKHAELAGLDPGCFCVVDGIDALRSARHGGDRGPWVLPCTAAEGFRAGHPQRTLGGAVLESIDRGAALASDGEVDALVTAPVNKDLIAVVEPRFRGHTEYLAERAGVTTPIMLFAGPRPHIALLTTHLPTATAISLIRADVVETMLRALHARWSSCFGRTPAIGVAALNPHAGEQGRLGTEEARVLYPAIAATRADSIDARGPYPADSIFLRPELDVVLALYHDQGTILAKRAPWPTVNLTLGLPYIRTSPDHGTAYDVAASGKADHRPMLAAMELAAELATGGRLRTHPSS